MCAEEATGVSENAIKGFEIVPATPFPNLYANNVQLITNYFDTAMLFGETVGMKGDAVLLDPKVRVVMNVSQIRLLICGLIQNVTSYEARFGKHRMPPEIIPPELMDLAKQFDWVKTDES
ncbi:MAG: hypothetical protein WBP85_10330 [Terracidiphilus sp.]